MQAYKQKKLAQAAAFQEDEIKNAAANISKLGKDEALALIDKLAESSAKTDFEVGGVLSRIQENKWYDVEKSFAVWVKKNAGMSPARAWALIRNYRAILTSGIPWTKVQHLGWAKLTLIADKLETDAAAWIEAAGKHSKAELAALLKTSKSPSTTFADATASAKSVKLAEKLKALPPQEIGATMAAAINALDKDTAKFVLENLFKEVVHDLTFNT
ncbi:hypothetical protein JDN40_04715 [Rhodomicrobium vannielii ATCC 17100]|uniref:hypothetical protein n=1 Tax=Rhodomicrobium vannielii TaxID=1069 RepID=UPI00191B6143|nr:hypothetical protein [Rhodomicrobium vannielii]MBJ7533407.1 hypothetical protein [Rhodomicrobium vannielii ATCC 17100]